MIRIDAAWLATTPLDMRAGKRSAHTSVAQLEQSIRDYIDRHNQAPKPFVWHKSADTILASVARAASSII